MNRFTIKKLTVSGGNHQKSTIEFINGLNLIIGPSNSGKSLVMDCIDYVFGFTPQKNKPSKIVDNNHGYQYITLELNTQHGIVTLKREIGSSKIKVHSTDSSIENGIYNANVSSKKSINSVYLTLLGITDEHKILASQKGDTQRLTWRSMLHLFFIKQNDIDRESSALLSPSSIGTTYSTAVLLYLLTGKDANGLQKSEDPKISEAKRQAVMMYIRDKTEKLVNRKKELSSLLENQNIGDIKSIVDNLTSEINIIQSELNIATEESQKIMAQIYEQNGNLSACNTMIHNFDILNQQYQSDIQRLGFIVDGQAAYSEIPHVQHCPFCDSELKDSFPTDYINATYVELNKIKQHIVELTKAQQSINKRKEIIECNIKCLENKKNSIDNIILNNLHPKLASFESELSSKLQILRWQSELELIQQDELSYKEDLHFKETEETPTQTKYNISSFYEYDLVDGYEKELVKTLKASKIGGASTAKLNMNTFDIEINNHSKPSSMGGGYCAILNTIVTYAMESYIYKLNGKAPGFYAIDSPLTQLSEAEHIQNKDSIKQNFMQFLISHSLDRQVIMIEQKKRLPFIPAENIDAGVHIIEFSQNKDHGRYGFLNDVFNPRDL